MLAAFWILVILILSPDPQRWLVRGFSASGPAECPLLSVLISARNEEHRVLARCIRSILAQDVAHLEVVVVDDRSTDNTLQILRHLQDEDDRLKVVEGAPPPSDFVGKPHGMAQALAHSRGEWVVMTDADILFAPEALGASYRLCQEHGYDVLSLWPRIDCGSFWEYLVMPWDLAVTAILFPLERVNGSQHRDAFAIGGFIMARRDSLVRIGGLHSVRHEVAEDFALGVRFKQAGHRLRFGFAPDLLRTRDYTGAADLWEGMTRKLFANVTYIPSLRAFRSRYRGLEAWRSRRPGLYRSLLFLAALLCGLGGYLLAFGPLWEGLGLGAALAYALPIYLHRQYARFCSVPVVFSLLAPLGLAAYATILLAAAWKVRTGRGLTWRGRRVFASP